MRILLYAHTYIGTGHNAGAETTLHDIAIACKRAGHKVMALASRPFKDGSGSFVIDGVPVQAYGSKQDPDLHFPRFDVVLTQFECAQRAHYIGDKYGIPTVQLVHNNTDYATKLALRYNDYLIYNSKHVRDSIQPQFAEERAKGHVVLHPIVNPGSYAVESSREYITLVNLSDGDEPFYNKGYQTFYELATRFPQEKFLGVKGAYGNQVVKYLPNVTFAEHTNNILSVYRKTKLVLMPSEIESYGRVALEAACSAIPSVTSRTDGLLELGIAHRTADFNDFPGFEKALSETLEEYPLACYKAREKAHDIYKSTSEEVEKFLQWLEVIVP